MPSLNRGGICLLFNIKQFTYELSGEGGVFSNRLYVLKAEIAEITPPTKNKADPLTNMIRLTYVSRASSTSSCNIVGI